jgi:DNA-binding transcriptional ArsR family regulator
MSTEQVPPEPIEAEACDDGHDHGPTRAPAFGARAYRRAAALFQALGDPERLRLLDLLTRGEACVSELVSASNAGFSTVSQRLRVLRSEGLVTQRRAGKHIYYALADHHVVELVHNALEHVNEAPKHEAEEDSP